jgi:hypothetical protein
VSRDAALRALKGALEDAPNGVAVLVGPQGPTRGIVLQALAEELGSRFPSASLRRPTLPPGGLWMELAARLDLDGGYDAKRRILRLAGELSGQGRGILVVIDGADALPGESLYGLLEVARSELGFYLLLGWPSEGEARPLPDGLFVARLDGTAVIPAPAFLASHAAPEPAHGPTHGPAHGLALAPASAPSAEPARLPDPPRSPEPVAHAHAHAQARAPEPDAAPVFAPRPSLAAPPRYEEELPLRVRTARTATLQRTAWIASGLAVGLLIGAFLGARSWRNAQEADLAPVGAADRGVVYAPASEPPAPFDPDAQAARRAAQRAREAAAARAQRPEPAPPPEAVAETLRPAEPAPAPPPSDVARQAAPPPGSEVAAAPPATPDVGAPPPAQPEAPPLQARDLVGAPEPARTPPSETARRVPEPRGPYAEGRLTVRSETPVMIEVDGRPLGPTPLAGIALSRGEHRVIAYYGDGSTALKTIYLASDDVAVSFR